MNTAVTPPRLRIAFAGTFSIRLEERVRAHLRMPCDVIRVDEGEIVSWLPVARAEIVDESALYRALAQRTIAGAALDVWYQYPKGPGPTFPAHHAFQELPNVLMTPHVSGWTEGMLEARAKFIAENIHRAAQGEAPVNLIPTSAA